MGREDWVAGLSQSNGKASALYDVALFKDRQDSAPSQKSASAEQLAKMLTIHEERAAQDGPLWSPVYYKPGASRGNAGVLTISCFVADFDDGTAYEDVAPMWGGLGHIVHSSFSHARVCAKNSDGCARWRAVFLLSRPVPAEEWPRVWRKLNAALGGSADEACKDAGRMYWRPSCIPGAERFAFVKDGKRLDPDDYDDVPETSAKSERVERAGAGASPGDDFNARADVFADVLEPLGWKLWPRRVSGRRAFVRPGKKVSDGLSAIEVADGSGIYLFSSSVAPLEPNRYYDAFGLCARLSHGGDFAAAASSLSASGYGKVGQDSCQESDPHTPDEEAHQTLADLATSVRDALNKKSARWMKERVGDRIAAFLLGKGRLLKDISNPNDPRPYMIADDGSALLVDPKSGRVQQELRTAGLNATESAYGWVADTIIRDALGFGREVHVRRWRAWKDGCLYISSGPRSVVRASPGGTLDLLPNGADGVLFAEDGAFTAWEPAPDIGPLTLTAFDISIDAPHESPEYSAEVQKLFLVAWMIAALAGDSPLPALVPVGGKDSGKSTLAKAVARVLMGPAATVSDVPRQKKDFQSAVTRSPLYAIDNIDGEVEAWFADSFAQAITGGSVQTSRYYSTMEIDTFDIEAKIIATTRTALFASRTDVVERTLPLFFTPRESSKNADDFAMGAQTEAARGGVLSMLARCAVAQTAKKRDGFGCRSQPLAARCVDICMSIGDDEQEAREYVEGALLALRKAQTISLCDDPLLSAMLSADAMGYYGTPVEILRIMREKGHDPGFVPAGKGLARMFRELKPALAMAGVHMSEHQSGNQTKFTIARNK